MLKVAKAIDAAMKKRWVDPSSQIWYSLFKLVDTTGDMEIDVLEFEQLVRKELKISRKVANDEAIRGLFWAIDDGKAMAGGKEKEGRISQREFAIWMNRMGLGNPAEKTSGGRTD